MVSIAVAVPLLAVAALRRSIAPDGFADRDGFFFAQAVERYSLMETRPFWPGYPVFIGIVRLATVVAGDAMAALHAVSAAASALAAIPLGVAAGRLAARTGGHAGAAALVAGGLWTASPLVWVVGSQSYSEPVALLFVLSALAVSTAAPGGRAAAAAIGILAGIAVGCRPPYAELLPALALVHPAWRLEGAARRASWRTTLVAFAAACAAWMGWQILHEGPRDYLAAARVMLVGHVRHFGGSMTLDPDVIGRARALLRTAMGHGLGAYGLQAGATTAAWTIVVTAALAAGGWRAARASDGTARRLLLGLLVVYGGVVYVAHDVRYGRYALPLVAALAIAAALSVPGGARAWAAGGALVAAGLLVAAPVVRAHAARPVLGIEVARWLAARPGAFVLVSMRDDYLPFFLDRRKVGWTRVTPELVWPRTAEVSGPGREVFSTLPPRTRPEEWDLAGRFPRGGAIEPHAPREILLFGPANAR